MNHDMPWLAGVDRSDYFRAAAEERHLQRTDGRKHYRAPADRPMSRRDGEGPTAMPRVTVRCKKMSLRDGSSAGGAATLIYDGWASVTGQPYEMWDMFGPYTELVTPGAFAKTLAQPELDVPFVLAHDSLRRIARTTNGTLQLSEDDIGLHVLAPELDPSDVDVAYIAPKLKSGLVDEMSFRFAITSGQWSPDWLEYHIDQVDIHRGDVAIVGYGANPHTAGSGLRAEVDIASLSDSQARSVLDRLSQRFAARTPGGHLLISEDETKARVL